jgi:hypothetical protein
MVNDTLAGILGTFPHFGSKWMPLPVERATNTCTALYRRSASGTTATTRTPYVAHPRVAPPAARMLTLPCAAILLAVRVISPCVVVRLALPPTDNWVPVMVSVWPLPVPCWL